MNYIPSELIKKKKNGGVHSEDEIRWIIESFTEGRLPDYQMSAWAMAVCFQGMQPTEIATLTLAMRDSGNPFDLSSIPGKKIDKHSTGGVGDKTSLIIGPILACAKVNVPMIAGRGLGHTGGTLDKLESIPGFELRLDRKKFIALVKEHHFALMGQTEDICPADKKFYALRDVTATVDSLPLICASIMSKKLSEDIDGLVLDVKFGSGAFMKTFPEALALAELLKSCGEQNGVRVVAAITNMNEPLGRFAGNSVEIKECLDIMSGKTCIENGIDFYQSTRELSLFLAGHMLHLAGKVSSPDDGHLLAEKILTSGDALEAFKKFVQYQGGGNLETLPLARYSHNIIAQQSGYLLELDTESIGLAGIELGAGRKVSSDTIDSSAGIEIFCKVGMKIEIGQKLFRLFANSNTHLQSAIPVLSSAIKIGNAPPNDILPLVIKVLS